MTSPELGGAMSGMEYAAACMLNPFQSSNSTICLSMDQLPLSRRFASAKHPA
jgi:hypothetical protein